jgi:hypothetical protein
MPRAFIGLDVFKAEIQDRIAAGEFQKDVRRWLAAKGIQIHRNTLSTRLLDWQGTSTQVASTDAALVAEVDSAFHTTLHDDQTVADNIAASGIPTTQRQVKRIRLAHGWRRRANTDDQLADRKTKTSQIQPIPSLHFAVGVSRFTWDEFAEDDGGNWSSLPNHWAVEEANRVLTSDDFLASILTAIRSRIKRDNVTKWLNPIVTGDWSLGHINPTKGGREIATWDEPKLLSDVIDLGAYDQYKVQGSARKIVTLWLYWTPEPPEPAPQDPPTPTPSSAVKKEKNVKKEKVIKTEKGGQQKDKIKLEPSTPATKRARPISTTPSIPCVTRRQAMDLPQEGEDEGDVEFGKDWPPEDWPVVDHGDIGDGEVASTA